MIAIALATAAAFNLVCTGTTFIGGVRKENQSPFNETYRLDLSAKRWCAGSCPRTNEILSADERSIMLKNDSDEKVNFESFILLNREDGSVLDRTKIDGQLWVMNSGRCERAVFSGFPARKF